MDSQKEKNFFDSRTLLAIVLVGVVFFGWQKYLEKKYPQLNQKANSSKVEVGSEKMGDKVSRSTLVSGDSESAHQANSGSGQVSSAALGATTLTGGLSFPEEKRIRLEFPEVSFEVSSYGMSIKSWRTSRYKTRALEPVQLGQSNVFGAFELRASHRGQISHEPLVFEISREGNKVEGTAFWRGNPHSSLEAVVRVRKILEFNPQTFVFSHKVFVSGQLGPGMAAPDHLEGLYLLIPEQITKPASTNFLLPSFDYQEFVVRSLGSLERVYPDSKQRVKANFDQVSLAGVSSQYFTTLSLDKSPIIPRAVVEQTTLGELLVAKYYEFPLGLREVELSYQGYMGPKSLSYLQRVDPSLKEVINFGIFGSIARVLLGIMTWFHGFVGNWGWSIILLTLLVRLVVLPFNLMSYKSMKKMAELQPVLQSIREKYKDDAQAINRETMAALKKSGANPIGGCLPILLQMPIFFALYQALGQSIELYQSPFIFWINDLSAKDPFYVLPLLMGLTLFVQQKITPTTLDPAQAKILMWLPVVFTVFTLGLPSGLTLYIFVSTFFGVIQQKLFMLDTGKTAVIEEAEKSSIVSKKKAAGKNSRVSKAEKNLDA